MSWTSSDRAPSRGLASGFHGTVIGGTHEDRERGGIVRRGSMVWQAVEGRELVDKRLMSSIAAVLSQTGNGRMVCRLMCTKNKTHHTHVSSRKSHAHAPISHVYPDFSWERFPASAWAELIVRGP